LFEFPERPDEARAKAAGDAQKPENSTAIGHLDHLCCIAMREPARAQSHLLLNMATAVAVPVADSRRRTRNALLIASPLLTILLSFLQPRLPPAKVAIRPDGPAGLVSLSHLCQGHAVAVVEADTGPTETSYMQRTIENFQIGDRAMRYSHFVPRLYNYCLTLGFHRDRMMPSRAFCSDESQGYPIMLIAQHFGTFPFDHGLVGGRVATDRHGPYAHHGEDLVIIQASHVGYDADTRRFGLYQRLRTADREFGHNCGKLCAALHWYQQEYRHACDHVLCGRFEGAPAVFIDNQYLDEQRSEGLFLHLERIINRSAGPLKLLSTSRLFAAAPDLVARLSTENWCDVPEPIGDRLADDLFFFRHAPVEGPEGTDLLEASLGPAMPALVTSRSPALDAARFHTQVEFDRTYRSIRRDPGYRDKNVLFVSGLNVDISPRDGLPFPLTKFVPWAAYVRFRDGRHIHLEQDELTATLRAQPIHNPDRMSFDASIGQMNDVAPVAIETPD
jgi:hypothetical protein